MQAPKLPALFSLFRQRGPRGFDYAPRYYDAAKEAREQRKKQLRFKAGAGDRSGNENPAFRERMRHSWQREGSRRNSVVRLLVIMALVCAVLYFIVKSFGLLGS